VAGRVIDEIGDPIAGAIVTAGKYNQSGTQEAMTDARGAFGFGNISSGAILFSVQAKGKKPEGRVVEVKPGMPELLFRLGRGQRVWGTVKTGAGAPIAGVRIALEGKTGGVPDTYLFQMSSDQTGRFEWDGAPDEAQNFCFLKAGYEAKRRQTLTPNEENEITLRPSRKVQGQVLDATTGQPLTKFRVGIGCHWSQDSFSADYPGMKDWVDEKGRFSLEVSEDETRAVKAEADDYAAQITVLPEAQSGLVQVVLRLQPSTALRGILVTADGAPVVGGAVALSSGSQDTNLRLRNNRLEDSSHPEKVVTADAAGEFVLPSPANTDTVVGADEKGFGVASVQQVRDSGRLVLRPFGRIEGTFTLAGQAVDGQELNLLMWDAGIGSDFTQYRATTDKNGRFSFNRIPSGDCRVMRLVKTSATSTSHSYGADVTVLPGQTAQVVLGDSGATLSGRIRFEIPPADGGRLNLTGDLSSALPPLPGKMSGEEIVAYSQSPQNTARLKQMKRFVANIAEDNTWKVDSIPPGTYNLIIAASKAGSRPWENPPVATGTAQVVVPEGATPQTQIVVENVVLRPSAQPPQNRVP
jgi:hypothetical protein